MIKYKTALKKIPASTCIILLAFLSVFELSAQAFEISPSNSSKIDLGLSSQTPIEVSGSVSTVEGDEPRSILLLLLGLISKA